MQMVGITHKLKPNSHNQNLDPNTLSNAGTIKTHQRQVIKLTHSARAFRSKTSISKDVQIYNPHLHEGKCHTQTSASRDGSNQIKMMVSLKGIYSAKRFY